ncbi:MAG TPA: hypothetical protein VMT12_01865 [Syntrophales bacterium]|nr:hypothetical protein [Syntrophales bacterium]
MTEENNTYLEESGDIAEKMMGSFSARVLHLENIMSHIMAQHFRLDNAERAALFLSAMTPDMSFRNKINIFINMIRIYYDEIYKIYDSDLRKLYELDQYRNDLVNLVIGKTMTGDVTEKEHESKVRLCIKLAFVLNTIQREILLRKLS